MGSPEDILAGSPQRLAQGGDNRERRLVHAYRGCEALGIEVETLLSNIKVRALDDPHGCLRINGDGEAAVITVPVIDSALRPWLLPPLTLTTASTYIGYI